MHAKLFEPSADIYYKKLSADDLCSYFSSPSSKEEVIQLLELDHKHLGADEWEKLYDTHNTIGQFMLDNDDFMAENRFTRLYYKLLASCTKTGLSVHISDITDHYDKQRNSRDGDGISYSSPWHFFLSIAQDKEGEQALINCFTNHSNLRHFHLESNIWTNELNYFLTKKPAIKNAFFNLPEAEYSKDIRHNYKPTDTPDGYGWVITTINADSSLEQTAGSQALRHTKMIASITDETCKGSIALSSLNNKFKSTFDDAEYVIVYIDMILSHYEKKADLYFTNPDRMNYYCTGQDIYQLIHRVFVVENHPLVSKMIESEINKYPLLAQRLSVYKTLLKKILSCKPGDKAHSQPKSLFSESMKFSCDAFQQCIEHLQHQLPLNSDCCPYTCLRTFLSIHTQNTLSDSKQLSLYQNQSSTSLTAGKKTIKKQPKKDSLTLRHVSYYDMIDNHLLFVRVLLPMTHLWELDDTNDVASMINSLAKSDYSNKKVLYLFESLLANPFWLRLCFDSQHHHSDQLHTKSIQKLFLGLCLLKPECVDLYTRQLMSIPEMTQRLLQGIELNWDIRSLSSNILLHQSFKRILTEPTTYSLTQVMLSSLHKDYRIFLDSEDAQKNFDQLLTSLNITVTSSHSNDTQTNQLNLTLAFSCFNLASFLKKINSEHKNLQSLLTGITPKAIDMLADLEPHEIALELYNFLKRLNDKGLDDISPEALPCFNLLQLLTNNTCDYIQKRLYPFRASLRLLCFVTLKQQKQPLAFPILLAILPKEFCEQRKDYSIDDDLLPLTGGECLSIIQHVPLNFSHEEESMQIIRCLTLSPSVIDNFDPTDEYLMNASNVLNSSKIATYFFKLPGLFSSKRFEPLLEKSICVISKLEPDLQKQMFFSLADKDYSNYVKNLIFYCFFTQRHASVSLTTLLALPHAKTFLTDIYSNHFKKFMQQLKSSPDLCDQLMLPLLMKTHPESWPYRPIELTYCLSHPLQSVDQLLQASESFYEQPHGESAQVELRANYSNWISQLCHNIDSNGLLFQEKNPFVLIERWLVCPYVADHLFNSQDGLFKDCQESNMLNELLALVQKGMQSNLSNLINQQARAVVLQIITLGMSECLEGSIFPEALTVGIHETSETGDSDLKTDFSSSLFMLPEHRGKNLAAILNSKLVFQGADIHSAGGRGECQSALVMQFLTSQLITMDDFFQAAAQSSKLVLNHPGLLHWLIENPHQQSQLIQDSLLAHVIANPDCLITIEPSDLSGCITLLGLGCWPWQQLLSGDTSILSVLGEKNLEIICQSLDRADTQSINHSDTYTSLFQALVDTQSQHQHQSVPIGQANMIDATQVLFQQKRIGALLHLVKQGNVTLATLIQVLSMNKAFNNDDQYPKLITDLCDVFLAAPSKEQANCWKLILDLLVKLIESNSSLRVLQSSRQQSTSSVKKCIRSLFNCLKQPVVDKSEASSRLMQSLVKPDIQPYCCELVIQCMLENELIAPKAMMKKLMEDEYNQLLDYAHPVIKLMAETGQIHTLSTDEIVDCFTYWPYESIPVTSDDFYLYKAFYIQKGSTNDHCFSLDRWLTVFEKLLQPSTAEVNHVKINKEKLNLAIFAVLEIARHHFFIAPTHSTNQKDSSLSDKQPYSSEINITPTQSQMMTNVVDLMIDNHLELFTSKQINPIETFIHCFKLQPLSKQKLQYYKLIESKASHSQNQELLTGLIKSSPLYDHPTEQICLQRLNKPWVLGISMLTLFVITFVLIPLPPTVAPLVPLLKYCLLVGILLSVCLPVKRSVLVNIDTLLNDTIQLRLFIVNLTTKNHTSRSLIQKLLLVFCGIPSQLKVLVRMCFSSWQLIKKWMTQCLHLFNQLICRSLDSVWNILPFRHFSVIKRWSQPFRSTTLPQTKADSTGPEIPSEHNTSFRSSPSPSP